jgi:WD40 repeat protein
VRFWNAQTGEAIGTPLTPSFMVTSADFSPDGKRVAIGGYRNDSEGGSLEIVECGTGKMLGWLEGRGARVGRVKFGPDGKFIVVASLTGGLQVFRVLPSGKLSIELGGAGLQVERSAGEFTLAANGQLVLCGRAQLLDTWWSTPIGPPLGYPGAAVFAEDDRTLLTVGKHEVRRWRVELPGSGLRLAVPATASFGAAAFSPDGKLLVVGTYHTGFQGNSELSFWEPVRGKPAGATIPMPGWIRHIAFSPDGKLMLIVAQSVELWDTATRKPIGTIATGNFKYQMMESPTFIYWYWLSRVAFSPDSRRLVFLGDEPTTTRLWDTATARPVGAPLTHDGPIRAVAFSADGKRIATGGSDKTARLWDAGTGQPVGQPWRHDATVDWVAFSPDGKSLLTSAAGTARLWDTATGKPFGEPIRHRAPGAGYYLPLSFSADGKTILSTRQWDAATGKPRSPRMTNDGTSPFVFSADGKLIVSQSLGTDSQLYDAASSRLYDAATGQQIGKLGGHLGPDSRTLLVQSWGPGGNRPLSLVEVPQPLPGDPARVRLWVEVITGRELDSGGEVADLDAKTWQERYHRLQKLGGPPLQASR